MLSESTSEKIILLYKKYLYDISLFQKDDLITLMQYYEEHPLFNELKKTKGITIFNKIIYNLKIKQCERNDTLVKFDSNSKVFNILLYGEIKKKNIFKGIPKQRKQQKNSAKYLYCIYQCLSNCLFVEINQHHYMKYIVTEANDLYNKFVEKISKYSFFHNLANYQYHRLFMNYEEKKYGQNEIIYNEGDKIDGIYLIIKGKCLIYKKKNNNIINNLNTKDNSGDLSKNYFYKYSNEMKDIDNKCKKDSVDNNNRNKLFKPIFAKNNKNNVLLTMDEGDIFGDLEINLNSCNNKREFSVKCANFNKTKVLFFPLNIIKYIVNKFQDLSEQKYDIILTRYQYANIVDKVKKEYAIRKSEIKLDELVNNSKQSNYNYKSFRNTINKCKLEPNSNNFKVQKTFKNDNYLNNFFSISVKNSLIKKNSKSINKNRFNTKQKLKLLNNKSNNLKNLISITKEKNYVKKVNSDMLAIKSIDTIKNTKINCINPFEQKLFLIKINKNYNNKNLIKISNNETF